MKRQQGRHWFTDGMIPASAASLQPSFIIHDGPSVDCRFQTVIDLFPAQATAVRATRAHGKPASLELRAAEQREVLVCRVAGHRRWRIAGATVNRGQLLSGIIHGWLLS